MNPLRVKFQLLYQFPSWNGPYTLGLICFIILFSPQFCIGGGEGGGEYHPTGRYTFPEKTSVSLYSELVEYLKHDYQPLATPICQEGDKLKVNLDMWLYQLFDLEEVTQMLSIDVWISMSWQDCGLRWDPKNFSNIEYVTIPAKEIWFPDLINYESLHGNFEEGMFLFGQSNARVRYDGTVQLGTQALLKTFCHFHVENYPFDTQICNITFSSWNKDYNTFEISSHSVQESNSANASKAANNEKESVPVQHMGHTFAEAGNGEWNILAMPSFNLVNQYRVGDDEMDRNYSEVRYQLVLQRKPTYVQVYLIAPCLILIWVASITFLLPVECGEKIGLAITVMLSLIVFLLLVAENIPRSSDGIPILGKFFAVCIGLVFLCVLMTTFVLNVGLKSTDIMMPKFLHHFLRHRIGILFCFRYTDSYENHKWFSVKVKKENEDGKALDKQYSKTNDCDEVCPTMEEIPLSKNSVSKRVSRGGDNGCRKNDWQFLALLLDRMFFIIYVFLASITTVYISLQKPMNFESHN